MKSFLPLLLPLLLTTLSSASANAISHRSSPACPTDNWGNAIERDRKVTTIRPSANDTDDISAAFLAGIQQANNGGLLFLEKGNTYVIGKKLDLSFLKNIYVRIEGEIKVSNIIPEEREEGKACFCFSPP